ncbi:MAG: enoyl-CoA hydratase [Deltaproteobacteria bacterium]|jgi:glutathione S-transferase|nr:enoyl-CoA hydratase [Deltaproteobacteria bacterium]
MSIGDGEHHVILGREESGYSMKVRSAMRFKAVPHEWIDRKLRTEKLFQAHARVQLIPLLFLPDGSSCQDSTPILEGLEKTHPEPSFHPAEPATRFLSELLEEYGDEWANKLMFHYRWGYPADQRHRSGTLARGQLEGHPLRLLAPIFARFVVRRMIPRLALAGANDNNAPVLVESFHELVALLEAHLEARPYLFGARPAFGDFGLWGQLHQAHTDPTCGTYLRTHAPSVVAWIERMLDPKVEGPFESFASLEASLRPIFAKEVGPRFLAWDAANARAWEAGEERTELSMDGRRYYQKTFKYPAHTLGILRGRYAAVAEDAELARFLEETGCREHLLPGGRPPEGGA